MIDDGTLGSCTARSRTRITTPLPHARSVAGTFRVNAAFGSAVWWYTHVISQARARRGTSNVSALRVRTARRRYARVQHHWGNWPWGRRYKNTGKQGSGTTNTHHTHTQTSHAKIRLAATAKKIYWCDSLRGMVKHLEKGSPVKPWRQLQIGLWLITSQRVLSPQGPGQGSTHF